ncbi:MAG: fibrobacter succinogenes major paralogous domain-containing protein, partial [Flavobacteriales bacterium]
NHFNSMKKELLLSLCMLSVIALHAQQKQYVYKLDGSIVIHRIDSLNTMTFEGDNVILTKDDGSLTTLLRSGIDSARIAQLTSFHSCDTSNVHNPEIPYGTMTDQEGNSYRTVVIGGREWMAENLNTSIYRNGDAIPNVVSSTQWAALTSGAYCYYQDDPANACPYGKLYNWFTCVDERGLCPTGWHVPSDDEWSIMINYLDPTADGGNNSNNEVGIAMKSAGTIEGGDGYWYTYASDPSVEGTNSRGFSGLPGGFRSTNGDYYNMGSNGGWWSCTQLVSDDAWSRNLYYDYAYVYRGNSDTRYGWRVRCLRD